jgi:phosphoglycolate phosphatase-like HAD superfamily hydrolase
MACCCLLTGTEADCSLLSLSLRIICAVLLVVCSAGVLWQETHAVPGAPAFMRRLQSSGKQLLFATNNSGKSREEYMKKFGELGFDFKISPVRHKGAERKTQARQIRLQPTSKQLKGG